MTDTSLLTDEDLAELAKQDAQNAGEDLFEGVRIPMNSTKAVQVKTFVTAAEIAQATNINPHDIDNSLITIASLFSRFSLVAAQARLQRDSFASRLELLEAKLDKAYRDKAAKDEEKITEPKLAQAIRRNALYIQASWALNESKAVLMVLEGTVEALKLKRDMLVQMNKNSRDEYQMTTSAVPTNVEVPNMKDRYKNARTALRNA